MPSCVYERLQYLHPRPSFFACAHAIWLRYRPPQGPCGFNYTRVRILTMLVVVGCVTAHGPSCPMVLRHAFSVHSSLPHPCHNTTHKTPLARVNAPFFLDLRFPRKTMGGMLSFTRHFHHTPTPPAPTTQQSDINQHTPIPTPTPDTEFESLTTTPDPPLPATPPTHQPEPLYDGHDEMAFEKFNIFGTSFEVTNRYSDLQPIGMGQSFAPRCVTRSLSSIFTDSLYLFISGAFGLVW